MYVGYGNGSGRRQIERVAAVKPEDLHEQIEHSHLRRVSNGDDGGSKHSIKPSFLQALAESD
jgi:hypothetical protein